MAGVAPHVLEIFWNYCPMSSDTSATSNQPSANQLATKAQAWSALFSEPMSDLVKRYTSSVFFDQRMWKADITGSLAHAEMLAAQGGDWSG